LVAAIREDIHTTLEEGGFQMLPLDTWETAWAEGVEEDLVVRALMTEWGADCVLFPDLQGVLASFEGDEARWDGASQKVGETRSTGAKIVSWFLNALIGGEDDSEEEGTPDPEGDVWALSLTVGIENVIGARVYEGRGGIELLEGADFAGGIYFGDPGPEDYEVEEIPAEKLFQRPGRIRRAVRLALEGLISPGDAPF
jgi:hypothetical protein